MWMKYDDESQLKADLNNKHSKPRGGTDYAEGKWTGPGWYYWEHESRYFRMGAYDTYAVAQPATERLTIINAKIRELLLDRQDIKERIKDGTQIAESRG